MNTSASLNTLLTKFAGGVADLLSGKRVKDLLADAPPRNPQGALHQSSEATGVAGQTRGTGPK